MALIAMATPDVHAISGNNAGKLGDKMILRFQAGIEGLADDSGE
jgi:hypothetical protein